jgi:hypothetical protein
MIAGIAKDATNFQFIDSIKIDVEKTCQQKPLESP